MFAFKRWLVSEMAHASLGDKPHPIPLKVDGVRHNITDIDWHFEDYGQMRYTIKNWVQEFPPHVQTQAGQVFVFCDREGYWWQQLNGEELQKLHSGKVFADPQEKRLVFDEKGEGRVKIELLVNPFNALTKIDPKTILDTPDPMKPEEKEPAKFHPPYDQKPFLHWWDFAQALAGNEEVKKPCRIRS